jgi:hypothetical protein
VNWEVSENKTANVWEPGEQGSTREAWEALLLAEGDSSGEMGEGGVL